MGLATQVSRETVYTALFTQLKTAVGFKTYSRRWRAVYDDLEGRLPLLPMMILYEQHEDQQWPQQRGIGPIRTWGVTLEIYAKIPDNLTGPTASADSRTPGASVLNPLIDAIDAALQPQLGEARDGYQSLGGIVTDCRIEGTIIKVLGDEDPNGQCGALIPIRILVP